MKILKREALTVEKAAGLDGLPEKAEALRTLRKPLLEAFDVYKSNAYYGIVSETEEEHAVVLAWYRALLDLDESALKNMPAHIEKYVRKEK